MLNKLKSLALLDYQLDLKLPMILRQDLELPQFVNNLSVTVESK